MPKLLVGILEFTVRYFFVLGDEVGRMKLARKARAYHLETSILHLKALRTMVQLIAVLFLRSMSRAEKVYLAMLARGYHGDQPVTTKNEFIARIFSGVQDSSFLHSALSY
jgi:cobalt/nickel transport system permease protein